MDESSEFKQSMRYSPVSLFIWLPVASINPHTGEERFFTLSSRLAKDDFQVGKKGQERKNIRDFFQALRLLEDMELGLIPGEDKARWRDPGSRSLVTRLVWRKYEKSSLTLSQPLVFNVQSDYISEKESSELQILDEILSQEPSETEKDAIAKSRVGQGLFRNDVERIFGGKCAITGSTLLLTASHIKPWRDCSNRERLDPYNGLLLSPVYDKAFDSGLISFDDDGRILLSRYIEKEVLLLAIDPSAKIRVTEQHKAYLKIHREEYFRK